MIESINNAVNKVMPSLEEYGMKSAQVLIEFLAQSCHNLAGTQKSLVMAVERVQLEYDNECAAARAAYYKASGEHIPRAGEKHGNDDETD